MCVVTPWGHRLTEHLQELSHGLVPWAGRAGVPRARDEMLTFSLPFVF